MPPTAVMQPTPSPPVDHDIPGSSQEAAGDLPPPAFYWDNPQLTGPSPHDFSSSGEDEDEDIDSSSDEGSDAGSDYDPAGM